MKVSVITVCKNSEATIERCRGSVLVQEYPNIEHVIVDGNSKDDTVLKIKILNQNNLTLVSEPDSGIYEAMNRGIALSTGDIVCFLNSDDWYKDSRVISEVVDQFSDSGLDLLLSNVCFVASEKKYHVIREYSARNFSVKKLAYGIMPPHPGMFSAKRLIDKVGFFKTDFKIAGDFDYVCRVFKIDGLKYSHLDRTTVYMSPGGASNAGLKSKIILNQEVLRAAKENNIKIGIFSLFIKYLNKIFEMRL